MVNMGDNRHIANLLSRHLFLKVQRASLGLMLGNMKAQDRIGIREPAGRGERYRQATCASLIRVVVNYTACWRKNPSAREIMCLLMSIMDEICD